MAVTGKQTLRAELPPEAGLGRLCLVQAQWAVQESWAHLDPCVTHGCFPEKGQLQGRDKQAIWAVVCEILPQMPWELRSFKYNTLFSCSCVFLCSYSSSDSFPVALNGCKIAKADPSNKKHCFDLEYLFKQMAVNLFLYI